MPYLTATQRGRLARREHKGLLENPYRPGPYRPEADYWAQWRSGWWDEVLKEIEREK